jgi:hypothetical protein
VAGDVEAAGPGWRDARGNSAGGPRHDEYVMVDAAASSFRLRAELPSVSGHSGPTAAS